MFSPSAHQDSPIQTISQMFLPENSTEPLDPCDENIILY